VMVIKEFGPINYGVDLVDRVGRLFDFHAAPLGHSQDSVIDLSNSFSNKKL
jgi:hypothetical protein